MSSLLEATLAVNDSLGRYVHAVSQAGDAGPVDFIWAFDAGSVAQAGEASRAPYVQPREHVTRRTGA